MIIQTNNKTIIFIHPPRSSGTSIECSLMNGDLVPDNYKHLNANQIQTMIGEEKWNDAFKFGIIRNPWDRMASLYVTDEPPMSAYNNNAGRSMSEFLSQYKPRWWEYGIQCSDYLNEELDFVIRFENRKNDINKLNDILSDYKLNIDSTIKKRQHNNKKSKDFMSYFDDKSNELMNKMFVNDIEKWYTEILK